MQRLQRHFGEGANISDNLSELYQNHELINSLITTMNLTLEYLGATGVQDFLECDPHSHQLVLGKKQFTNFMK